MKTVKQLAIFLENQPGALFRICRDLAQKQINIKAISVSDSVDHAVVRLVVDKPHDAIHMLGDAGVLVVESDLLEVELKNIPGEMGSFCQKLMDKGLNIEYAYGSTKLDSSEATVYIRVMDMNKINKEIEKGDL